MNKRVLIAPAAISLGLILATSQATSAAPESPAGGVRDGSSQVDVPGAGPAKKSQAPKGTTAPTPKDKGDGLTAGDSSPKPSAKSKPDVTDDDDSASAAQVSKVNATTARSWYSGMESSHGVKVTFSGLAKGKTYYASTAPGPTALDSTNSVVIEASAPSQTVTFKPHGAGVIGGANHIYVDNPDGSRHDVGSFSVNDPLADPSFALDTTSISAADLGSKGLTVTGKNVVGSDASLVVNLQEHEGPDSPQSNPESLDGTSTKADKLGNAQATLKTPNATPGQYDLFVYNDAGTIVYEQVVTVTAQ